MSSLYSVSCYVVVDSSLAHFAEPELTIDRRPHATANLAATNWVRGHSRATQGKHGGRRPLVAFFLLTPTECGTRVSRRPLYPSTTYGPFTTVSDHLKKAATMISRFRLLPPGANFLGIAQVCRECVRKMRETRSYEQIVSEINNIGQDRVLTVTALKTFLARESVKRFNNTNIPIETTYNFLLDQRDKLEPAAQAIIMSNWAMFSPGADDDDGDFGKNSLDHAIPPLFCKWVDVSEKDVARLRTKLQGHYVMLRKSVVHESDIVKSEVMIGTDDDPSAINVRHVHVDRMKVERISDGFAVPIARQIYLLTKIEGSEGLDFVAVREPIQQRFQRLLGFLVSMNIDRKILCSRVYLERNTDAWKSVPGRFTRDDVNNNEVLKRLIGERIDKLLDKGTSPTIPDEPIDC